MDPDSPALIDDPFGGYRRLDPLPSDDELEQFYAKAYGTTEQSRAPDVLRLREETPEAAAERRWRFETLYTDAIHHLADLGVEAGVAIDVGCGTGEFLRFLGKREEWTAHGVERDILSLQSAQRDGLSIVGDLIDDVPDSFVASTDLITMFNVLEHVPDPAQILKRALQLLRPGGALVVQVPNDFSEIQLATQTYLNERDWWVAIPDHLNYFNFASLRRFIEGVGFEVRIEFGSFPMEFFLVAGIDYLNDRSSGSEAHRRRCDFEMSLNAAQRRSLGSRSLPAGWAETRY